MSYKSGYSTEPRPSLDSAVTKEGRRMMAKQVFVVDDEKTIADTLAAILSRCGYDVLAFYDAESTLIKCESLAPDLVISDVMMPGMNGVNMAIVISERFPACKILLFSGQATTMPLLDEARGKGYDFELLAKPIHPKDLLASLEGTSRRPPTRALNGPGPERNIA